MSTSHDPSRILRYLAECLDVQETLDAFPGMTKEELKTTLRNAADSFESTESKALLWVDGAARGNPGPAGAGFVLEKGKTRIHSAGQYLGEATNNEAEYQALIMGLKAASHYGCDDLEVRSDSQLMVRQLKGEYRVKSQHLQGFYLQAVKQTELFRKIAFAHVRREENKEADRLANMAIDLKGEVSL
jgi:ribonuclease HI